MFDIKMTINGRPLTESSFADEMEKAVLSQIQAHIQESLSDVPTELDGEQLIVELEGDSLDDLSIRLTGPEELIAKAKEALGAE